MNVILLILIGIAMLVLLALLLSPARSSDVEADIEPAYLRRVQGYVNDDYRGTYSGGVERSERAPRRARGEE